MQKRIDFVNTNIIEAEFVEIPEEVTVQDKIKSLKQEVEAVTVKAVNILRKSERTFGFANKALKAEFNELQDEYDNIRIYKYEVNMKKLKLILYTLD